MISKFSFIFLCVFFLSCTQNSKNPRELVIEDLPFHTSREAKVYSDLILHAIKTNRDMPILQEFQINNIAVNGALLNKTVKTYSLGIGGRDDWEFHDISQINNTKVQENGFDYAWLDPQGRMGIQIFILPELTKLGYRLSKIEFRSRLGAMESLSFPGSGIESYKKLDFQW